MNQKPWLWLASTLLCGLIVTSCVHHNKPQPQAEFRKPQSTEVGITFDERRGSPAEYDPGAPADSKWVELFGSTPNYRSLGIEILGGKPKTDEKFRWVFGPMWYRGRLTPESVKVFVVGQEGAQDENISNRSFTGSTGTRVQKFLNHMGIYRSYLFLNTFVYTINGQLGDKPEFKWMEQGENSPIVEYRHKLFDYMLETNSETVALFMGVGSGGKASVATWVNARGGRCSPAQDLKDCDVSGMIRWFAENRGIKVKNPILVVGVPHPGGANPNLGGEAALKNIQRGFTQAANRTAAFKKEHSGWLPFDRDEKLSEAEALVRMEKEYEYKGYAPIPFRDFAFNTNWAMGSVATTSNRWGADSIQVFSKAGIYNDKSSKYPRVTDLDSGLNAKKTALNGMQERDLPYESPRYFKNTWSSEKPDYDFGPCGYQKHDAEPCELAKALVGWPDMKAMGIQAVSHPTLGYFGTYRGRGNNAKVFVVADQSSHDDFFSTRALTGTVGQKLQTIFELAGVGSNYFIMRSLPVDTLGADIPMLLKGVLQPEMLAAHKRIYDAVAQKSDIKVILALGPVAKIIAQELTRNNPDMQVIFLDPNSSNTAWNVNGRLLANLVGSKYKETNFQGKLTTIPREDLPYHTRWWMGSTGDRAARGEGTGVGNYYRVWAPQWVNNLAPLPLTAQEKADIHQKMQTGMNAAVEKSNENDKDAGATD